MFSASVITIPSKPHLLRSIPSTTPDDRLDGRPVPPSRAGTSRWAVITLAAPFPSVFSNKFSSVATATTGVPPELMGIGPISATQKALDKVGLSVKDIDLFEINEAFAAQCIACQRTLGIDMDKLNVNGGGISLGHPVGATGARIVISLLYELKRRGGRYGVATLCAGGGMGTAVLIEIPKAD